MQYSNHPWTNTCPILPAVRALYRSFPQFAFALGSPLFLSTASSIGNPKHSHHIPGYERVFPNHINQVAEGFIACLMCAITKINPIEENSKQCQFMDTSLVSCGRVLHENDIELPLKL